jgi:hypothetical protein
MNQKNTRSFRRYFLAVLGILSVAAAQATNYTVTNGNNTGAGSLRAVITAANADASVPHNITFSYSGNIAVPASLPVISRQVVIDGGNAVTLSGPGGDNYVALFTLGAGAGNSTLRGFTMRNTGVEPILISAPLSGVTIENMFLTQTGAHYMNHAIYVNANSTNLTIRNVRVTGVQDAFYGLRFAGTVTNLTIDRFNLSGGTGNAGRGIRFFGAVNGLSIKNSIINLDDPATGDDGDYGIYFDQTANDVTIDSTKFNNNEIYGIYVAGVASNFTVSNSNFDNKVGWTQTQFVRFNTNTSNVTLSGNTFDADLQNTTDDGDYGIVLVGVSNQSLNILNNKFNEHDINAIFIGGNHANNTDNVLIKGNTFTNNGSGGDAQGGIRFYARNTTSDGGPVLITENTFNRNNGVAVGVYPGNTATYVVPNFTISKNTIYNTQSTLGAVYIRYVDKINITENSIYNNKGLGIELASAGNCGYEGINYTPQIQSSVETSPGVYTVAVKMPAVCGTGNCTLELFSNEVSNTGIGGKNYVGVYTNVASGVRTFTGVTGAFPEITAAPYGFWTATLKVNNNCGTSEFSNKQAIKVNGPAGISNGIQLWLNPDIADIGTLPAGKGWQDFSGNQKNFDAVFGTPVGVAGGINYNTLVRFNGNSYLRSTKSPFVTSYTAGEVITILRTTTTAANRGNPYDFGGSSRGHHYTWGNAAVYDGFGTNKRLGWVPSTKAVTDAKPGTVISGSAINVLNWNIFGTHSKTGDWGVDFNGGQQTVQTNTNVVNFTLAAGNEHVGAVSGSVFIGDIAEEILYNRTLTAVERQTVNSYLALKYGITLSQNYLASNGTVLWNLATNAGYNNGIAGLSRDNISVLHQKQSKSISIDDVIAMSTGNAIQGTNEDNDNEIGNNISSLIWGGNNLATTIDLAITSGTRANTRMRRIWKVQKTNYADQQVTLQLTGGKANMYLIISNDPTFATLTSEVKLNASGAVTFNSALLNNGAYFTFGREQQRPGGVVTGLSVWLKADEGVTLSGTSANTWQDQSPSQRIWPKVNTTATLWSNAAVNFNPAINFPASSYFSLPQFTQAYTAGEVFSVQYSNTTANQGHPFELGGAGGTSYYKYNNEYYNDFGRTTRPGYATWATRNVLLPHVLNSWSATNDWAASFDGGAPVGAITTASAVKFSSVPLKNYIGAAHNNVFNGRISEVIMYNRKLNATERRQVNSYMALRYGVTLDQTTASDYLASDGITTMWKAADNTGYNKDIAGIGRDDNGTLLQMQSRSVNANSVVTLGVGNEIAASNDANKDTIVNDKSFLVWADNGGAVVFATAVTAENATTRMARVWKVDKTNWADRDITLKANGFTATNAYLLLSTDAAFASIDQEFPLNPDGTITLNSDQLPDGTYFTFGKAVRGPGFVNNGIQMWLRADDATATGASWNDYSGNDVDAVQATAGNQPVLTPAARNFNPAFRFDGTNDYLDVAYRASLNGNITVFSVHAQTVGSSWRSPISSRISTSGAARGWNYYHNVTGREFWTGLNAWSGLLGGNYTPGTLEIAGMDATLGNGNSAKHLFVNGLTAASVTNASYAANTTAVLRIGALNDIAQYFWNGDITESIVYNRVLNTVERNKVESYLALKYGITINQTVPTDYVATDWDGTTGTKIWTAAKNGVYNKNIAGIGMDARTDLNQKQSRSANDSYLTVALGTAVAADNLTNTGTIDNMSFFTWADNGGATTFSRTTSSTANATTRMPRVWKVDRTNWNDQDVTIKIPAGGDRYLLVHSADSTFGTGTAEFPIKITSSSVTINTAQLPDGAYFTIGTKIVGPGCVNNGVVTWLRSDYAADATGWVDFSGNQINATAATAAPTFNTTGFNFNPSLSFNGTTQHMVIPNALIAGKYPFGNTPRTIIGVGAANLAPAVFGMMLSYGTNGTGTGTYLGKDGVNISAAGFGSHNGAPHNVSGTANKLLPNALTIIGGRYTGTAGAVDVNGTQNVISTAAWNTNAASNAYIGVGVSATTHFWNGRIGEVIVYNRQLTTPELLRVNSYLGLKYGITINEGTSDYVASDGTTTMWSVTDNAGYNGRITGVGRDDCDDLYQKQSISQDTGIVTLAIGSEILTDNVNNVEEIDADNSYFVIGDNKQSAQYNTDIAGVGSLTTRMARIWKVDKTNWADADVTMKLNNGNEKIYLVVSADATFDGNDEAYQLDANGNVTLSTAEIPDGAHFTFAKEIRGPGYVNAGVALWLRADDAVSSNENWLDYSGNDNDATQATLASQPEFTVGQINYNPGFVFNGAKSMSLDITKLPIGTTARTLIGVGVPANITGTRYMFGWGAATASNFSGLANVANAATFAGWTNDITAATQAAIGAPQEMFGTWAGAGGLATLYSKMRTIGTPANKVWNTGTAAGAFIGSQVPAGNQSWFGSLGEVVVYNRVLTAVERQKVSSYLALKYGYTIDQTVATDYLATDSTVYWDATANATYKNNITGIGRDDNTALYQKQSRNVNTVANGNMVAVGLNALDATNQSNTTLIAEDKSFLVWGDDGLSGTKATEYPAVLDPGGCSRITRLNREWKVQKTGEFGDVQMQFYLSGLVPSSTGIADLKLLVNDNSDFSQAATRVISAAAFNDTTKVVTFNTVDLNDGEYFTLVTNLTNQAPGGITSSLYTWYRADKGIAATTTVSQADDQSASGFNAVQATAGNQPAYNTTSNLFNYNPSLGYNSTNSNVLASGVTTYNASAGEDIFAVVLPTATTSTVVGLGTVASSATMTELRYNAGRLEYVSNANTVLNATATTGAIQLANVNRTTAAASAFLNINGAQVATGSLVNNPTLNQLNIGSRRASAANSQFYNGQVAEVAIFNRQLTATERLKVTSYFAMKYGITQPGDYVSPNDTVMWSQSANVGYGNRITGIGRDDCNGLHQKQSKSVHTGALVVMSSGTEVSVSNKLNVNDLENNSALVAGDNNAAINAWSTAGKPQNRDRLARQWKVQKTGSVGTVTIQVPASVSTAAAKLPLERDGAVYLLVDDDGDFSNGATEVPMALNGSNWEANTYLENGQYFTFATNDECVATTPKLATYNSNTVAASSKCVVDGWILFRDNTAPSTYIAAVYDPAGLIDVTKINAEVSVNTPTASLGKGNATGATRLMRRMLQVTCNSCFDATENPNPNFKVRMFYNTDEQAAASLGNSGAVTETNSMTDLKATNNITDQEVFYWFKAEGTVASVIANLQPTTISLTGRRWDDGVLNTGNMEGIDFIEFDEVNRFSTFGGYYSAATSIPLSVQLTDFVAQKTNDSRVQFNWATTSEKGSDHFEVERSTDGLNFDNMVARMKAAGSSSVRLDYQTYDREPAHGLNYYRLKMLGTDGKHNYSVVRRVSFNDDNSDILVYPTDNTTGVVNVVLPAGYETATIHVVNAMGQYLPVSTVSTGLARQLELKGLPAGQYLISVWNNGMRRSFKVTYHP